MLAKKLIVVFLVISIISSLSLTSANAQTFDDELHSLYLDKIKQTIENYNKDEYTSGDYFDGLMVRLIDFDFDGLPEMHTGSIYYGAQISFITNHHIYRILEGKLTEVKISETSSAYHSLFPYYGETLYLVKENVSGDLKYINELVHNEGASDYKISFIEYVFTGKTLSSKNLYSYDVPSNIYDESDKIINEHIDKKRQEFLSNYVVISSDAWQYVIENPDNYENEKQVFNELVVSDYLNSFVLQYLLEIDKIPYISPTFDEMINDESIDDFTKDMTYFVRENGVNYREYLYLVDTLGKEGYKRFANENINYYYKSEYIPDKDKIAINLVPDSNQTKSSYNYDFLLKDNGVAAIKLSDNYTMYFYLASTSYSWAQAYLDDLESGKIDSASSNTLIYSYAVSIATIYGFTVDDDEFVLFLGKAHSEAEIAGLLYLTVQAKIFTDVLKNVGKIVRNYLDDALRGKNTNVYQSPTGGGGVTNSILTKNGTVTFGHGGRHINGLNKVKIEKTIANQVPKLSKGQKYIGVVNVDGSKIEFRAYGLGEEVINVGTYFPVP